MSDVRSTLSKGGGNLASSGAVAWQFDQRGVVIAEAEEDAAEDLALTAIDAGVLDFETDDGVVSFYSEPGTLEDVRGALDEAGASIRSSELSMVPQNTVTLDSKEAVRTLRLLDQLEELDDVQRCSRTPTSPTKCSRRTANSRSFRAEPVGGRNTGVPLLVSGQVPAG